MNSETVSVTTISENTKDFKNGFLLGFGFGDNALKLFGTNTQLTTISQHELDFEQSHSLVSRIKCTKAEFPGILIRLIYIWDVGLVSYWNYSSGFDSGQKARETCSKAVNCNCKMDAVDIYTGFLSFQSNKDNVSVLDTLSYEQFKALFDKQPES